MLRPPISCPLSRHVFSHNVLLLLLLVFLLFWLFWLVVVMVIAGHVHVIILVKICECKYCRPHSQYNVHILCTFAFRLTAKFIWPSFVSFFRGAFWRKGKGLKTEQELRQWRRWQQRQSFWELQLYFRSLNKTFNYILSHALTHATAHTKAQSQEE